jgi:hypothetical protein
MIVRPTSISSFAFQVSSSIILLPHTRERLQSSSWVVMFTMIVIFIVRGRADEQGHQYRCIQPQRSRLDDIRRWSYLLTEVITPLSASCSYKIYETGVGPLERKRRRGYSGQCLVPRPNTF